MVGEVDCLREEREGKEFIPRHSRESKRRQAEVVAMCFLQRVDLQQR